MQTVLIKQTSAEVWIFYVLYDIITTQGKLKKPQPQEITSIAEHLTSMTSSTTKHNSTMISPSLAECKPNQQY